MRFKLKQENIYQTKELNVNVEWTGLTGEFANTKCRMNSTTSAINFKLKQAAKRLPNKRN